MIRRSVSIGVVAVIISVLVHMLGLGVMRPVRVPETEASESSDAIELGNEFEDLAGETAEPVEAEAAETPEPEPEEAQAPEPEETDSPEPEEADIPTTEALVASADPQDDVVSPDTGSTSSAEPETTEPVEPGTATAPDPELVTPSSGTDGETADQQAATPPVESGSAEDLTQGAPEAEPVEPVEVAEPVTIAPVAVAPVTAPPVVTTAPKPDVLAALPVPIDPVLPEQDIPSETVVEPVPSEPEAVEPVEDTAEEGSELAVKTSIRPRLPERRPTPSGVADGSSAVTDFRIDPNIVIESPLTSYQRTGSDIAQVGGGSLADGLGFEGGGGPGNSTVSNYAGQVLVQLNRAPTSPVSGRGSAQVIFEIRPNGTLAWVDVVDGSGSAEVDSAAKMQVRAAAPFPPTPDGRSKTMSFFYRTY